MRNALIISQPMDQIPLFLGTPGTSLVIVARGLCRNIDKRRAPLLSLCKK